jgi:hypothetical protein
MSMKASRAADAYDAAVPFLLPKGRGGALDGGGASGGNPIEGGI